MLPTEIIQQICSHLDFEDLLSLGEGIPQWSHALSENVFRDYVLQRCPTFTPETTWRKTWQECARIHHSRSRYRLWAHPDCHNLRGKSVIANVSKNKHLPEDFESFLDGHKAFLGPEQGVIQYLPGNIVKVNHTIHHLELKQVRYEDKRNSPASREISEIDPPHLLYEPCTTSHLHPSSPYKYCDRRVMHSLTGRGSDYTEESEVRMQVRNNQLLLWFDGMALFLEFGSGVVHVCVRPYDLQGMVMKEDTKQINNVKHALVSPNQRYVVMFDEFLVVSVVWDLKTNTQHYIPFDERRDITMVGLSRGELQISTFDNETKRPKKQSLKSRILKSAFETLHSHLTVVCVCFERQKDPVNMTYIRRLPRISINRNKVVKLISIFLIVQAVAIVKLPPAFCFFASIASWIALLKIMFLRLADPPGGYKHNHVI